MRRNPRTHGTGRHRSFSRGRAFSIRKALCLSGATNNRSRPAWTTDFLGYTATGNKAGILLSYQSRAGRVVVHAPQLRQNRLQRVPRPAILAHLLPYRQYGSSSVPRCRPRQCSRHTPLCRPRNKGCLHLETEEPKPFTGKPVQKGTVPSLRREGRSAGMWPGSLAASEGNSPPCLGAPDPFRRTGPSQPAETPNTPAG